MSYCDPSTNLVTSASMTNQVASTAIRRESTVRTGGGIVSLSGSYTGTDDETFDVEVTSTTIVGDPQISDPIARGVGNGTISAIAADPGSTAQAVKVTLVDLGIRTLAAFVPFENVTLRAKESGVDGNGIAITVDRSGIVHTPTTFALPAAITNGDVELLGEGFNFGAKTLNADGTIPADTARISFGSDPTVYRQYRFYKGGQYRYKFDPPLYHNYQQGDRVNAVTGTYSVSIDIDADDRVDSTPYVLAEMYVPATLNGHLYKCTVAGTSAGSPPTFKTDGTSFADGTATFIDLGLTPEVYASVQTSYDLLSAAQSLSDLIEVDGAVAVDTKPGGQAIRDLNLHTASYVSEQQRTGTSYVTNADFTLTPGSDAPSEALKVVCRVANRIGDEIWQVSGSVSGELADAVTGVPYTNGAYGFTIPLALGSLIPPEGSKKIEYSLSTGASGCHKDFVLGAQARSRTYKFSWVERGIDCFCDTSTIAGGPNPDFLGVDPTIDPAEGSMATTAIASNILTRRVAITTWLETFISSQIVVSLGDAGDGLEVPVATGSDDDNGTTRFRGVVERASALVKIDEVEVGAAERVAKWLRSCLNDIDESFPDTFPAAAGSAFDTLMTDVGVEFAKFSINVGALYWARIEDWVLQSSGIGTDDPLNEWDDAETTLLKDFISSNARPFLITSFESYVKKFKPKITKVYEAAALNSPFDSASGAGSGVWQDHGGSGWFVSDDDYLEIQPGYYYHSARMEDDGTGTLVPTSTQEFGVGIHIGCPENLTAGDSLLITISDVSSPGVTYQPGDAIRSVIIRADPIAFGGGQDGDDTLTFRVEGSVDTFAEYALDLDAPIAYDDNDLSFLITEGAIAFALEDEWTFSIEGGVFQWRTAGGAWTTGVNIAPSVSLSAGLSAIFTGGAAPSFAVGDAYGFTAVATNGPVRLETPDSTAARWTGSTTIVTTAGDFDQVLIWHDMDSTCTITMQGSDDDFSSTPLSVVLPWTRGTIAYQWATAQTYAKARLVITGGDGRIYWAWLGEGYSPELRNGTATDPGRLTRRRSAKGGGSGQITHTQLSSAGVDSLEEMTRVADLTYGGRVGMVYGGSDARVIELTGDLSIEDVHGHQPNSRASRIQTTAQDVVIVA